MMQIATSKLSQNETTTKVLNNFVKLMCKAYPDPSCRPSWCHLHTKLSGNHLTPSWPILKSKWVMCGRDWSHYKAGWEQCAGIYNSRGLPCGLWLLLHSLLVEGLEADPLNSHLPGNVAEEREFQSRVEDIRMFIKFFFACEDCTTNFLELTKDMYTEVTSQKTAVMFLWKVHNEINKIVNYEEAEVGDGDPHFIKTNWPPRAVCSECYASSAPSIADGTMGQQGG